jgi:hypothetical protein
MSNNAWRQTLPRSNFQRPSNGGAIASSGTSTRSETHFDRTTTRNQTGSFQTTRSGRTTPSTGVNRTTRSGVTANHVFATRSANWQPNWNRNCDHWWNGHRCRFVNNSWVIFDFGFYPWWPIGYPYDYGYGYGYGYPYDYGYGYGYDPGYYGYGDGGYYQGDDQNYGQDGYGSYGDNGGAYGDNGDASVAAAQERLAREGYYHGQIDGVFGPETQRALRAFQRDRGLDASGYLTLETRRALGLRG